MNYRDDIDGLRAIAVIAVRVFHLGYLPNGYLGVDIFFVISGFLITSIVYHEAKNNKFSTIRFYERRIRRIIPLLLVTSSTSLLLGLFLMLPDDLENLCQSVIASNCSLNNILMLITSSDYWAIRNEYKPLMHTWSLGIEEQFYLIYPIIFLFFNGKKLKYILPLLVALTLISFILFSLPGNIAGKFYLLQFRFFELSVGGICAVYFTGIKQVKKESIYLLYIATILLLFLLFIPWGSNFFKVISVAILTSLILSIGKYFYSENKFISLIFKNRIFVFIGKISFSLYMWHQIVFGFARYSFVEEMNVPLAVFLCIIILILSVITFYFIENPFRNKVLFPFQNVILGLGILFIVSTSISFYVYSIGGIIKDYPSLDLYKKDNKFRKINFMTSSNNINIKYNRDIRQLDRPFEQTNEMKVLVVGNSYGRDVSNIILESSIGKSINLSYFDSERAFTDDNIKKRWEDADLVIIAAELFIGYDWIHALEKTHYFTIDTTRLYCFGTKDFGYSNGIHYSQINNINNFSKYFTKMKSGIIETDEKLKDEWGNKYISLIDVIRNKQNQVLVFTPDGKFISQDTDHLTQNGAKFYAKLLSNFFSEVYHRFAALDNPHQKLDSQDDSILLGY